MSKTSEILFEYLREVFYNPAKATLDIDKLEPDYVMLGKGLMFFAHCFAEYNGLAASLSRGELQVQPPPPENELAAPLKSLQANLRHLTWQAKQVASGDYKQRVDFMGDFADAFNLMITQLEERERRLEEEIRVTQQKSEAMEQSNQLLSNITQNIPQQIIVVDRLTHELLFTNDSAKNVVPITKENIEKLFRLVDEGTETEGRRNFEILFPGEYGSGDRYLSVNTYFVEWNKSKAEAFVINDISAARNKIKELETFAFRDALTNLHNRSSGMITLNRWLGEKKAFCLIFVDLDSLKYINDVHGHSEGDLYIVTAANYLKTFSKDAFVCRVGGDEFMLFEPDVGFDEANARMHELARQVENDPYLEGKDYQYSISFGIAAVDRDNKLQPGEILSLADSRMYEFKRSKRKERITRINNTQEL